MSKLVNESEANIDDYIRLIIEQLQNKKLSDFGEIFKMVLRISDDLDKGIVYTNKFLDNIISLVIEFNYPYFIEAFDAYNEALEEDETIIPYIIDWLSNKDFILKRFGSVHVFIKCLKQLIALDEQTKGESLTCDKETLNKISAS